MLNLLAGRRLILTYLIANVLFILLVYGLIRTLGDVAMEVEVPREMGDVIAVVLLTTPIVIFYGLAYLLLHRRQVKW
jgi:4-amino-4-deoxy-L-arabinose transferase-like glycosyltransferase